VYYKGHTKRKSTEGITDVSHVLEAVSMRKVQPVSFSLTDPFESQLYKYAMDNGAFSKYIKRLIQRDMERGSRVVTTKKAPAHKMSMTQLTGIVIEP
jgi:hypothetical protein